MKIISPPLLSLLLALPLGCATNDFVKQEVGKSRQEIGEELSRAKAEMTAKSLELKSGFDKAAGELKERLDAASKSLEATTQKLQASQDRLASLEEALGRNSRDDQERGEKQKEEILAVIRKEIGEQAVAVQGMQASIATLKSEVQAFGESLARIDKELDEAQEGLRNATGAITAFNASLADVKKRIDSVVGRHKSNLAMEKKILMERLKSVEEALNELEATPPPQPPPATPPPADGPK